MIHGAMKLCMQQISGKTLNIQLSEISKKHNKLENIGTLIDTQTHAGNSRR